MSVRHISAFGLFKVCFSLFIAACVPAEERAQPKLETKNIVIVNQAGEDVSLVAELARTAEEQGRGLMFRKKLEDGEGMLFVYERDQILSFWMKNTTIPLSIAFISGGGRIVEIKDMRPLNLSPVRSSRSVRYALEAPQGWFERSNISAGCAVKM
ncbi:MAG: DUF192 domain-containing protein [Spirochaetaceae bacterium]|jgi:uncharacterized membrane protein (UPF0127 family)|nr:DUF192 domain-containing protein [Spirochaetaceae bacterium]